MILAQHIPILAEILTQKDFLRDPVLSFGFQDSLFHKRIRKSIQENRQKKKDLTTYLKLRAELAQYTSSEFYEVIVPWQFMEYTFNATITNYGMRDVSTIDLFDERADFKHDMNLPIPDHLKDRFHTIIDIGSTEHIFDTRQCLENLFNMLRLDGRIMIHIACAGCFDHGFYTFSPEAVIESLKLNGFEIEYIAYTLEPEGIKIDQPVIWSDVLLWCVGRKVRVEKTFNIPQQKGCKLMYGLAV